MKYKELQKTTYRSDRYQHTHPVLIEIEISGVRWLFFRRLLEENDVAKLIASDSNGKKMVARVACLDREVAAELVDGWT